MGEINPQKEKSKMDRIFPMPKPITFWEKWKKVAINKEAQHSIHFLRCNPDYRKNHPNECRDNPDCKKDVHPEALTRIKKQLKLKTESAFSPTVKRPERLNR